MAEQKERKESVLLREGERIDDLERDGLVLIQNAGRFRYGVDAVLLSWFAQAKEGETVLDLCTGTGVIPILMTAKTQAAHFSALEIQPEVADMAARSVCLNRLEDRISVVRGDVKEASRIFGGASFDIVTVNPPYLAGNGGIHNADESKAISRHEILCTLEDVIRESSRVLKPGGRIYMVHRPFRLTDILVTMSANRISPRRLRMVYPRVSREANLVLIEGIRGGRTQIKAESPVILQEENGEETLLIKQIHGRA